MAAPETTPSRPPSPLLQADNATIVFTATKDGTMRVNYPGWDDPKVVRAGEHLEVVIRNGQVNVFKLGEPRLGPEPDAYKDWDGTPEPVETATPAERRRLAAGTPLAEGTIDPNSPLEPIGR